MSESDFDSINKQRLEDDIVDDIDTTDDNSETLEKKYEKAQRELITQTVDFNIRTLANMVSSKQIDTNPRYQRRLRWDEERQSKLIESLLMNIPIPPLFFAEEQYGKYAVIDGQQRLRTLEAFFDNMLQLTGLKIFSEINGLRFSELPNELQSILNMRPTLRCIIILRQSHPEIKFEVFERINTGGIRLNPQEIRNSAFRGPLNDLILDLSELQQFRKMLKVKNPKSSKIVQHMRDCELVLRFFSLKDTWDQFPGSLKMILNRFMEKNQNANLSFLSQSRKEFIDTLQSVYDIFGDNTFRRYDPDRIDWGKQVLASIFDAQMLACYNLDKDLVKQRQNFIIEDFKNLFNDRTFIESVGAGTNQKSKIIYRVTKVRDIILGRF